MFSHIKELFTRPSGYNISRSVRLRSSASAYFNRTPASTTSQTTWTWSGWVKRGTLGTDQILFGAGTASNNQNALFFSSDSINFLNQVSGTTSLQLATTAVYRDPSAWYHIVAVYDSTNGTSSNRAKLYVNGVQISSFSTSTYPSSSTNGLINSNIAHVIGKSTFTSGAYVDGYLTEVNFIDGQQLTPSSFGETDSITGVWKPKKYTGTYGTNGFYLNFSDNSNNTATTIGKDYSGNANNWTPNNISVTAGATYDSMTDVPTLTSITAGNFCTLNPLEKYSGLTIADGNLKVTSSDNTQYGAAGTFAVSSGKWYYEAIFSNASLNNMAMGLTTTQNNVQTAQWAGSTGMFMCGNFVTGTAIHVGVNGSYTQVSTTLPAAGSYLVCAVDYDNGKAWFGTTTSSGGAVTWYPASTGGSVGDPAAGTNPTITFSTTYPIRPFMGSYSAGLNWIVNFGQRPFITTAPSGFNAWNTFNLPDSTIKNGAGYMAATTYAANNGTQSINNSVNGVSFQPDFIWTKSRSNAYGHLLYDSIRGVGNFLQSASTAAESNNSTTLISFNSNGYTVGSNDNSNLNTGNSVGWQWKAGGTSSSNTNGSITSTVSVGATQGFSVVTYTGTGANATVGHGLGVAPSMIIIKQRSTTTSWAVYHSGLTSAAYVINLNLTSGQAGPNTVFWNSTAPTSTVFSLGTGTDANASGATAVAYCFAAVAGYSAFGSYTGNGSSDGPFVYTGFRPRFFMIKRTDTTTNWIMYDTTRMPYNSTNPGPIYANLSSAEETNITLTAFDILSNGFKLRNTSSWAESNASGGTYIYMAFAENPFKNALAR